jgi:hypothetical protein
VSDQSSIIIEAAQVLEADPELVLLLAPYISQAVAALLEAGVDFSELLDVIERHCADWVGPILRSVRNGEVPSPDGMAKLDGPSQHQLRDGFAGLGPYVADLAEFARKRFPDTADSNPIGCAAATLLESLRDLHRSLRMPSHMTPQSAGLWAGSFICFASVAAKWSAFLRPAIDGTFSLVAAGQTAQAGYAKGGEQTGQAQREIGTANRQRVLVIASQVRAAHPTLSQKNIVDLVHVEYALKWSGRARLSWKTIEKHIRGLVASGQLSRKQKVP